MSKIDQARVDDLMDEILMAEAINEQELEPILNESIARYTGRHVPYIGQSWDIILNEVYPIIQNTLPSIFFRNPRAFLKPRSKTFIAKQRDPVTGKIANVQLDSTKSAQTQQHILNYSLVEMKYKQETRKVLMDALHFPYGVMWHGYKGDFGMTEEQAIYIKDEKVFVKRINPMMFGYDPSVNISEIEEGRFMYRAIDVPLSDIIEDDKLDVDKKLIKGFDGYGKKIGTKNQLNHITSGSIKREYQGTDAAKIPLINSASERFRKSDSSKFLRVYEVFLRPTKKEARQGNSGWILLLTKDQKKPLRSNDWLIKAEGFPGKILEFNPLNDSQFGMADIDTYKSIADQKNAVINLQLRNAQETCKTWVGISKEAANEDDIQKIVRGENTIVFFESGNPKDRMFVASASGAASQELYILDQRIQKNLEDKSGVSDLKRGFLQSGEESAASVKIRAAGSSARPMYRQDIMGDFLSDSFHYINQLNKQFVPFKDAVRIMGTLDLQWSENPTKEELQADTDVEIDAISMLPESPETELRDLNNTLLLAIQAISNPQIYTKIQQEGKTINLSPLIERILLRQRINDPEVFRSIRPEESMGYVSVEQMREAKANVDASLTGQPFPFPPQEGDDHRAKLEMYSSISTLMKQMGQVSEQLEVLIMQTQALLAQQEEKEAKVGQQVNLKEPTLKQF